MTWCEANDVRYVLGLAGNSRLHRKLAPEMRKARIRAKRTGRPARVFVDFAYRTRKSWSAMRRVIGKAEWTMRPGLASGGGAPSCGERLPTEVQLVAPIESESGPDRPPGLMGIGGPKPGTDEPFAKPPEVPPRRVDWLSAAPARRPVDVATAAPRATSLPASFQDSDPSTSS